MAIFSRGAVTSLCLLVFCVSRQALGFRPQASSVRSSAALWNGCGKSSGSLTDDYRRGQRSHNEPQQQQHETSYGWRGSAAHSSSSNSRGKKNRRGAAGGLRMQQTEEELNKTKMRLRCVCASRFLSNTVLELYINYSINRMKDELITFD